MNQQEWNELNALRKELNENIMAFDAYAQERFTELLVKSLAGKGDEPPRAVSRT